MISAARVKPSLVGRLSGERGYTLIELVIVMALSVVVVGGPMSFIVVSLNQQNVASSRSAAVEQASVGLSRLTRDIRQVVPGTTSTFTWGSGSSSATATMTLPVPGTGGASTEQVVWTCSFSTPPGTCTRAVNGGTAVRELSGVDAVSFAPLSDQGVALSTPASNPAYVGITLKVLAINQLDPGQNQTNTTSYIRNPITLQDGVDLRTNT
jgi:prepilin-type N-terminal cleavage/methylation domain-containing protein